MSCDIITGEEARGDQSLKVIDVGLPIGEGGSSDKSCDRFGGNPGGGGGIANLTRAFFRGEPVTLESLEDLRRDL